MKSNYTPKDSWIPLCGLTLFSFLDWWLRTWGMWPNWAAFVAFIAATSLGAVAYAIVYR